MVRKLRAIARIVLTSYAIVFTGLYMLNERALMDFICALVLLVSLLVLLRRFVGELFDEDIQDTPEDK